MWYYIWGFTIKSFHHISLTWWNIYLREVSHRVHSNQNILFLFDRHVVAAFARSQGPEGSTNKVQLRFLSSPFALRTSRASRNRDWWYFFVLFPNFSSFLSFFPFFSPSKLFLVFSRVFSSPYLFDNFFDEFFWRIFDEFFEEFFDEIFYEFFDL